MTPLLHMREIKHWTINLTRVHKETLWKGYEGSWLPVRLLQPFSFSPWTPLSLLCPFFHLWLLQAQKGMQTDHGTLLSSPSSVSQTELFETLYKFINLRMRKHIQHQPAPHNGLTGSCKMPHNCEQRELPPPLALLVWNLPQSIVSNSQAHSWFFWFTWSFSGIP